MDAVSSNPGVGELGRQAEYRVERVGRTYASSNARQLWTASVLLASWFVSLAHNPDSRRLRE
jgi:hypothetical protein